MRLLPIFSALLALCVGLASATDLGTIGTMEFPLHPGGNVTRQVEVARCFQENCSGVLQLSVAGEVAPYTAVDPVSIDMARARAGEHLFANVTVSMPVNASLGAHAGTLQVSNSLGDTWRYTLNVTVRPLTGGLNIFSEPPGAEAYLDGRLLGLTPLAVGDLAVGSHDLRVVKSGQGEWRQTVPVVSGAPRPVTAQLPAASLLSPGTLALVAGAAVALAGLLFILFRTRRGSGVLSLLSPPRKPSPAVPAAVNEARQAALKATRLGQDVDLLRQELHKMQSDVHTPSPERIEQLEQEIESLRQSVAKVGEDTSRPTPGEGSAEMLARLSNLETTASQLQAVQNDIPSAIQRALGTFVDAKTRAEMEARLGAMASRLEGQLGVLESQLKTAAEALKAQIASKAEGEAKARAEVESHLGAMAASLESQLKGAVEGLNARLASKAGEEGASPKELAEIRSRVEKTEAGIGEVQELVLSLGEQVRELREAPRPEARQIDELSKTIATMDTALHTIQQRVETLQLRPKDETRETTALKGELEVIRSILVDHQEETENLKVRLKNQELTLARTDEVHELFRSLASQKEDLAQVRLQVDELVQKIGSEEAPMPVQVRGRPATVQPRKIVAMPPPRAEPEPTATTVSQAELGRIEKEIRETESFLESLEEYRQSGLMSNGLYLERKTKSEKHLRELREVLGRLIR